MQPPRIKEPSRWARWLMAAGSGNSYRYIEELIAAGNPLFALGQFHTHGGANTSADSGSDIAALLSAWKQDGAELKRRFDTNQDEAIDLPEWEFARGEARVEVNRRRQPGAPPPAVEVLGNTLDPDRPYLISAAAHGKLVAQFGGIALVFIAISAVAAVILSWGALVRATG
ncbi:MAG: hypothetical protein EXR86_05250 [Gammaproteobacteria bacterium]|nr:hypothetical protein [Gammaproteobacteria bacterium]